MPLKLYKRGEVWWYRGTVAERVRWCGPPVHRFVHEAFMRYNDRNIGYLLAAAIILAVVIWMVG